MPFGQSKSKGEKPFFQGQISEYEGKTRISLWPTEEFKKFMEDLAR